VRSVDINSIYSFIYNEIRSQFSAVQPASAKDDLLETLAQKGVITTAEFLRRSFNIVEVIDVNGGPFDGEQPTI